ncbi:MAG TPA: TonB-dependent receptor [Azospira sp.]|nr:TonB-dependent receptor [Azospira sp.]
MEVVRKNNKHMQMAGLLLAAATGGAASQAWGQEQDESLYFGSLPVVASVSRLPQRQDEAPTSVTVLDRDMIKASGARDLNDVFRLVPGFQTYPNNTDTARVSYHGLTDEDFSPRIQVLIDGRSQYSPLFRSGVNWAVLPVAIEDIERIEVVRGPNAASYGSNAFLGVINIITVDPALVRGASLSTNIGNQGVRDTTLRTGGKLDGIGDVRFTLQQKRDTGLTNRGDWTDGSNSDLFDFRGDLQFSDRDSLQLSASRIETDMAHPKGRYAQMYPGPSNPESPIRELSQASTQLQAMWRRSLQADSDVQLRYAYTSDWADGRATMSKGGYLYTTNNVSNGYVDGRGYRHEIEAQHNFAPFADTRLVWGGGWRQDTLEALPTSLVNTRIQRRVGRVFGNLEWKPARWFTGNLGISSENDSLAGSHTSPRVSANFHLNDQNTVRLAYARAYRSGSAVDYQGNALGIPYALANGTPLTPAQVTAKSIPIYIANPNLPAEQLDTWEIGYLGDWKDWRMGLDVRLFTEQIPNRTLIAYNGPDQTVPAQKIRIDGVEYTWKWQPFNPTRLMLNQALLYTQASFLPSALDGPLQHLNASSLTNLDLMAKQASPRHSTSMLLMQKLPLGLELSVTGYWVDYMKWTRNSSVLPYSRFDGRLGYPFRWGATGGEIAFTTQSMNGPHGEFKANNSSTDRIVERRSWVSLRLDL